MRCSLLFLSFAALALGQCIQIKCAKVGHNCSTLAANLIACTNSYCNLTSETSTDGVCIKQSHRGGPCLRDGQCINSQCENSLCWAPNGKGDTCGSIASCSFGLVCNTLEHKCISPFFVLAGQQCGTEFDHVDAALCEYPNICSGERCIAKTVLGASCTASALQDTWTWASVLAMSVSSCGAELCVNNQCTQRFTQAAGAACTMHSQCASGICGLSTSVCVDSTTAQRALKNCSVDTDCTHDDSTCVCDTATGSKVCTPRLWPEEITAQKSLYACLQNKADWYGCLGKYNALAHAQRLHNSDPCNAAPSISALIALLAAFLVLLL